MDVLAGLLDEPRARGAFLLRSILTPPWSLRIEDRAPLSLTTVVHGTAWVRPDGGAALPLRPGDVALARGPEAYTLMDQPGTPPQVTVGPDQRCGTVDGRDVTETRALGVRTWGVPSEGATVLLSGTYQLDREVGRRVLETLPPLLVRPVGPGDQRLIRLLTDEIDQTAVGQELVLDRMLDLLLVNVLRGWLTDPASGASWYQAENDPLVGPALRLLRKHPDHPWTVAELASRLGVSRSALARRFTERVGEPPMRYLSGWRITLAADLLREPEATVASVARRVGYASAFAFSAAFKRVRGMSPLAYRTACREAARTIQPSAAVDPSESGERAEPGGPVEPAASRSAVAYGRPVEGSE